MLAEIYEIDRPLTENEEMKIEYEKERKELNLPTDRLKRLYAFTSQSQQHKDSILKTKLKVALPKFDHTILQCKFSQVARTHPSSIIQSATEEVKVRITGPLYQRLARTLNQPGTAARVMIVDDEVFLLEYLRDLLEELGVEVYCASSAEEALKIADMLNQFRKKIALVFVDFNMPITNGAECTKLLKTQKYKAVIGEAVFTALTAQNDSHVKEKFRKVGVNQFIFKPYSFEQIQEHLQKNKIGGLLSAI